MVSIIIPTWNSERTLRKTLLSIQAQTYKNIEVIVIDAHSTDSTRTIASAFKNVKTVTAYPERSSQLNYGAAEAHGRYLYRVDSDFILEPKVVEEAVKACSRGATAVLIHNTSDPTISLWSKARRLERDCYRDETTHVAVRFIQKSDFQAIGGFLESLVAAEDYDLHNRLIRLGIVIARIAPKEVHIGEPRHLKEVVLKHVYYGKHIHEFIQSNPGTAWRQITPFRVAFLRHWRDFLADPKATLAFFFYEYVRYLSAMAGALTVLFGSRSIRAS